MGDTKPFHPVKLFCGLIYRNEDDYAKAKEILQSLFSPVDMESPCFAFDRTDYYYAEMGRPLHRRFISFRDLICPERLAEIKRITNGIEDRFLDEGRRQVNLDPGFLSDANVIIATTKNHYHRVPLRDGIYAHIEYIFHRRQLTPLDWTYPDFRSQEYRDFFSSLWLLYKPTQATG